MQLIGKFNKGFRFLLCVIDILVNMLGLPLKDKKGISIVNAFQKNIKLFSQKTEQNMG